MRPCPKCSAVLENQAELCPECGENISGNSPQTTAVKIDTEKLAQADRMFFKQFLILWVTTSLIVLIGCCSVWGWWGLLPGILGSLVFGFLMIFL